MPNESYTIADLARVTGLNVRTIRYYLAQGLLPASGESGPGAHYGEGHLHRLRLTKRLQAQHLPLSEIRARLEQLSDEDVGELVAVAEETPVTPETSALDYIRGILGSGASTAMPAGSPPGASPGAPPQPPPPRHDRYAVVGMKTTGPRTPSNALSDVSQGDEAIAPTSSPAAAHVSEPPASFATPTSLPAPRTVPPARDPLVASAGIAPKVEFAHPDADQPIAITLPERSQWERHALGPNIELHVRRPLSRIEQRRVERLLTIARQVLRDDQA